METFNARMYALLDNPQNGDIHQLCPKIVAFKGPLANSSPYLESNEVAFPPEEFVACFFDLGVTCVVRLNDPDTYDPAGFECAGIKHHDLYFDDCTVPTEVIVERLLDICDEAPGLVAVH